MLKPTPARRFTAAVAAAAIALAGMTATAVPARAQNNDAAKILFGLTALAIIGAAIANANQPPPAAHPVHPVRPPQHGHVQRPPHPVHPHRPAPAVHLPAHCEIRTGQGSFYGARCLLRAGYEGPLPQACARDIRTERGWRVVYDGACLTEGRRWR
jgi:hypothetical protein